MLASLSLALVLVMVALGGTASAAVVGLERVSPNTPSTSSAKALTATCPSGKRVLGAGGDTTPGSGHVLLDHITPNAALTSVRLSAREDETGTGATWFLQAFIVCGYPPTGLERVAATSPSNSVNKEVVASCPAGKKLVGAGADVNSANGQVSLEDIRPLSGLTGVAVRGQEDETGNAGNWTVTAYAICSNPVAGLQRVPLATALNSSSLKEVNPPCPAGKRVIGMGGEINSNNGQVVLDALFPSQDLTTGGFSAWEDDTGNTANWSLTGYAICVNAAERLDVTSAVDSVDDKTVETAPCPANGLTTGVGGEITGGLGRVMIHQLFPSGTNNNAFLSAIEDASGTDAIWHARAYAICATPPPGYEVLGAVSAIDSSDPKSVSVTCPAGKRVIGAGGVGIGGGRVALKSIVPAPGLASVQAVATDTFGRSDVNWQAGAAATCANAPSGLQRVVASTASDLEEIKTVTAACPAGKHLVGTGVEITGGPGLVLLDDLRPDAALRSVKATAIDAHADFGENWGLSAYAVCVNQ